MAEILPQKHPWNDPYVNPPQVGEVVLVRLKDNYVVVAYLNSRSEWKLNLNKGKASGGSTITDVSKWKKIDIN